MNLRLLICVFLFVGIMTNVHGQSSVFVQKAGIEQTTLGYCSDEIPTKINPIGFEGQAVSIGAAIRIPASKMAGMKGGKITKIRIGTKSGLTGIYVWIRSSLDGTADVLQRLGNTADGWNEITLDTPYNITGEEIYIGYSGQQPLGVMAVLTEAGNEQKGATYLSAQSVWTDYYGKGFGALYIQAIAQATLPEKDLAIGDLTMDKTFYKTDESMKFSLNLSNEGTNPIDGYSIGYRINDREEVTEDINTSIAAGNKLIYSKEIPVRDFGEGTHRIKVYISKLADGAVDEIALNDTLESTFSVYEASYPHKILLEQFTTIMCGNCPYGSKVLTYATAERDDVVWVAHHVGYGTDELTLSASKAYLDFGVSGAPAAMIDRTKIPEATDTSYPPFGIGYPDTKTGARIVTSYMDYCAAIPAFVSITVKNEYDPQTRQLKIEVNGERNAIFNTFYPQANFSVFLTENGILAKAAQSGATQSYVHNHVLRAILTETFGNAIEWENNQFTYTTTTTLDEKWVAGRMNVVAIINKPFDVQTSPNDAQVLNAEESPIDDPTYDSITAQQLSELNLHAENGRIVIAGDYDLEVYTPNGMQVQNEALSRGFYLVRVIVGDNAIHSKIFIP